MEASIFAGGAKLSRVTGWRSDAPRRRGALLSDALRRSALVLALCATWGLVGCGGDEGATPEEQGYFPLVEGARWRYQLSSQMGSLQMEVTARGHQALGGRQVFLMEERNLGPSLGFEEVSPVGYVVDEGYVARIQGIGYDSDGRLRELGQSQPTWILPLDPRPGQSWGQDNSLFDTPEGGGALMGWNGDVVELTSMTVPAGSFEDVVEVDIAYYDDRTPGAGPKVLYRDYYARGVGLVKSVTEDPTGDVSHTIEQVLVGYEFPAP
jgi:hypothetical protein